MRKQWSSLSLPLGALMIDIEGLELVEADIKRLSHAAVGSVILFKRNYKNKKQLKQLCEQIKQIRSPELPIVVDQEGGRVQRFTEEFLSLPALAQLGEHYKKDPITAKQLAYAHAFAMAAEIRSCGVDFSFAPVVDTQDLHSHVIGDRAFDADAQVISELAESYMYGLHGAGCISVAKHFPGHGGVTQDSHLLLPVDDRSEQALQQSDLKPYVHLIEKGLDALMTAHVKYTRIDDQIPAFSTHWLQQVLVEKMKFKGVIFSDDLTMKGAVEIEPSLHQRVLLSLKAGCHVVIICNDFEGVDQLLFEQVDQASILASGERLNVAIGQRRLNRAQQQTCDQRLAHYQEQIQAFLV